MKNFLIFLVSILLSCENKTTEINKVENGFSDKTTISNEKPLDVDSNFYEFMIQFSSNKEFQAKRCKIQDWKYLDFYEKQESTNLINAEQNDFEKDKIFERRLVFIDLNTEIRTEFLFKKDNLKWYLVAQDKKHFETKADITFENFLYQFSRDTIYRKSHINYPLKYSILDDNFEPTNSNILTGEEYEFDIFNYDKFLYFKDKTNSETKKINLWIRGLDNGIMVNLFFEKKAGKWYLTQHDDSST